MFTGLRVGQPVQPAGQGVGGHPMQDGVHHAGGSPSDAAMRQLDAGVHGGRGRGSHAQQLVGTQPQHVDHRRLQTAERAFCGGGDDAVIGALHTAGAGDQFGREGRVAGIQSVPRDQVRQDQIGVGARAVDRPEGLERHNPSWAG